MRDTNFTSEPHFNFDYRILELTKTVK
jgi:hypothetical protein